MAFAPLLLVTALLAALSLVAPARSATTPVPVGALYQINNNPDFNAVIVWQVNYDGSLTYINQVPTGGAGSGGGGDPLGSQGTVVVSGEDLFVVNANSSTIAYFRIDASNPTRLYFVDSAPTNGEFAVSVTVSNGTVCGLSGGLNNGIRCWMYNASSGLSVLSSWDRSLVAYSKVTGNPPGTPLALSQLSFSPMGDALVVTIRNPTQGVVLVYPISGAGLAASPVVTQPSGAVDPFGFVFVGHQNLLVATDPHGPAKPAGVTVVAFSSATGAASFAEFESYTFPGDPGAVAPCWAAYSPLSNTVIALDAGTALATLISVDPSTFASVPVASINVGKSVFEADYMPFGEQLERWYVNTPLNGVSVSTFMIAVNSSGKVMVLSGPAYSAPAAANLGAYVVGATVYRASTKKT